jgi:DNA gyrase/topoisomerase IV subunit A
MYIDKPIDGIIENNMMQFSQYVIKNRALPDLYSGMKPIHLKILWSMFENKTFTFSKSANVSGKVMVYSPHGDCYETIVHMVQNDRHIYNLILGQGNWGSSCSSEMKYAASRYTECKMSPLGIDCIEGLSKNMVEMINNYDGTKKMPKFLPTKFPLILCMASNGIAVGMANNSPSFNLEEVCNATISYLQEKEIPIISPDFATGGFMFNNKKEIERINMVGLGSIKLRAKYHIKDNDIIIDEIPYGSKVNLESIIDKIIELCKQGKLKEVTNVLNLTGYQGLRLEIACKKNTNMELLMEKLYKLTPLESTFSANMNVLVDGHPKVLGVQDIIKEWTGFRQQCVLNGINFDIDKLTSELHLLHGLEKVLLDIDKTVDIIRHSENIEKELKNYFNIDNNQVDNIINMKLKNINKDYIIKKISYIKEMNDKLKHLQSIITDKEAINELIIKDLKEVINKFKQPRRTTIISEDEIKDIPNDIEIEDYTTTIVLTEQQYLKKTRKYSDKQKLKDDDNIKQIIQSSNKNDLLLFTDEGRVFTRRLYELNECTAMGSLGEYLPNLLKDYLNPDEKIIYITSLVTYDKGYMLYIFENNNIVKMAMKPYYNKQNRLTAQDAFNIDNQLKYIKYIEDDINILTLSIEGKILIQNTIGINPKTSNGGKKSMGNPFMKLDTNINIVGVIFNPKKDAIIQFQTEKKDCIEINLSDIAQTSKNKISYFEHCIGKKNSTGNFVYNCRQKNDKILKLS